ncbi:hypothetical protein Tco_0520146 [Tanacetum coccineum]
MAGDTMEQYLSCLQNGYGSGVAMLRLRKKIRFETDKAQFLKELREEHELNECAFLLVSFSVVNGLAVLEDMDAYQDEGNGRMLCWQTVLKRSWKY